MATYHGDGIEFDISAIQPGVVFDTSFENNCRVAEDPEIMAYHTGKPTKRDQFQFEAYDSEGVKCQFSSLMVAWIHK